MIAGDIFGLPIPDAGPVFAAALVVHVAANSQPDFRVSHGGRT